MWDVVISGICCFICSTLVQLGSKRCRSASQSRILEPTEVADWLPPGHTWYGQIKGTTQFDSTTSVAINQNRYAVIHHPVVGQKEQFLSQANVIHPFSITDNQNRIRVIPEQLVIDTEQKTAEITHQDYSNSALRIAEQSISNNQMIYMVGQISKDMAGNLSIRAPEDPSYPFTVNAKPNWNALDALMWSGHALQVAGLFFGCIASVFVMTEPIIQFPQVRRYAGFTVARKVRTADVALSVSYYIKKANGGRIFIDEALYILRELEFITSTELPAQISETPNSITAVFLYANKQKKSLVRTSLQIISLACTGVAILSISDSFGFPLGLMNPSKLR